MIVYNELCVMGIVESMIGKGICVSIYMWGVFLILMLNWRNFVEGGIFLLNLLLFCYIWVEV